MGPLVDTSVLIDFFGGARTAEADALDALLAEGIPPSTAPVIVQEFLQGFHTRRELQHARQHLSLFTRLPAPDYATHEAAAALHRDLKKQGYTASTVDALIVAIAEAAGCALLTRDEHQLKLARIAGVEVV